MALIGSIYGLHVNESGQHIAGWLYVAGSLGVTLCGDYLTLFVFWELMAFASTFLIWYRKKKKSIEAGFRYLLVHTAGGLVLLAGCGENDAQEGKCATANWQIHSDVVDCCGCIGFPDAI